MTRPFIRGEPAPIGHSFTPAADYPRPRDPEFDEILDTLEALGHRFYPSDLERMAHAYEEFKAGVSDAVTAYEAVRAVFDRPRPAPYFRKFERKARG